MLVNINLDDADLTPHIEAKESHKINLVSNSLILNMNLVFLHQSIKDFIIKIILC